MAHPALLHHDATQFAKAVIDLSPGVWGAVGYAAANMYMIEGARDVTIVDTTESTRAAETILALFRERSQKPVGRILYTHSHRDHISGAAVVAQGVPVIAAAGFRSDLVAVDDAAPLPRQALGRRTQAQFGMGLSPEDRVSLGCGPGDRPMEGLGAGHLPPSELIDRDTDIDLGGVPARLILAPGETADHMVVWLPGPRVLLCGDNWYHAFPNLYAIRGTPYRDFGAWAATLARLADLGAEVLGPGHTRPVFGAEAVAEVLTTTRAAILHVMEATAGAMDRGLSHEEIAATVALPDDLSQKPWLGEFYGKVCWSARAYATGTLGWYDGNPTHLGTLTPAARARHVANLSGGVEALAAAAEGAADPQWRLELCDHLIALGHPAEALKAATLRTLAEDEINATARNTYLWHAARLEARP